MCIRDRLGTVCQAPKQMGVLAIDTMLKALTTGDFDQGLRIGIADEVNQLSLKECEAGWHQPDEDA